MILIHMVLTKNEIFIKKLCSSISTIFKTKINRHKTIKHVPALLINRSRKASEQNNQVMFQDSHVVQDRPWMFT